MTIIMFATGLLAGAGIGAFIRAIDKVKLPVITAPANARLALKTA